MRDIRSSAHNSGQRQPRSDPTASQTALSRHSYPTPQNQAHPSVQSAPSAPWAVVAAGEAVAAAGRGTPGPYFVNRLADAVVAVEHFDSAGKM
jgi:hypothetical protein